VRFDPVHAPLQGPTVIEANAGTGKTFTITALYVRLLLEVELPVGSILVVTFTEAATGELRDRIRTRLAETHSAFERGAAANNDEFTAALLERIADHRNAVLRLTSALRDFDQAPIYTIHGFCQRVLADCAFETGMPFKTDIVPDQSAILREIVEDFWRSTVNDASPLYARYLAEQKLGPDALVKRDLERNLGKPYVEIRRPAAPGDVAALERDYERAHAAARAIWVDERAAIEKKLLESGGLSGSSYRRASMPAWFDELHEWMTPVAPPLELCKLLGKFTAASLRKGTNKGGRTPEHPFFDACGALAQAHAALIDAFRRSVAAMEIALLGYCNAELAARKARRQLQSYDDLLLNLAAALKGDRGRTFAERLRARYRAALIDEFQDTDPVQYEIFQRIYGGTAQPLFLVGDPKQSIYSFRGADVYAYLGARTQAQHTHTLTVNWRSAAPLLKAVNRVFDHASDPFVLEDIPFAPSTAAAGDRGRLVIDGGEAPPLELWLIEGVNGKSVTKGAAQQAVAHATAAEIVRLLDLGARGLARIERDGKAQPLSGGDIAVLVRTHYHGDAIRDALAERGVASVQRGTQSVFATREAAELECVLAAIAEPGREPLVGGALATEMLGYTGGALHALRTDEARWEAAIESFRDAHREWHENGFARMLRGFLKRHAVIERLLDYRDGERRATNLLHVSELVHCEAGSQSIGAVLAWLAAKRRAPARGNEAELLRLESDENLVKIFTVHASKGLEFPLVFCPFAWDGGLRSAKGAPIRFHDPQRGHTAVLDLGSDTLEQSRPQAVREERAEGLRLFYVALTRAKYRCWVAWGNVNEAQHAAPAWLIHRRAGESDVDAARLANDSMRADVEALAAGADGAIRVGALPEHTDVRLHTEAVGATVPEARRFDVPLRDTRRVTSFTALAHGRSIEAPDYDAADRAPLPESVSGHDIFAFPRGAQAGKCLHVIFEEIDFTRLDRGELERIVAKALAAHGYDAVWIPGVARMVESVVNTPLSESGMSLREIGRERRLDELEFYYPIRNLSDSALRGLLRDAGFPDEIRTRIDDLSFAPARGYMRGFIDLVFEHEGRYYLADYKSNWIGASVAAYRQAELARVMAREAYYLQYLVYCVALHRYLRARLAGYSYDAHFGGVFYLFLRGMQPKAGSDLGIYRDRPDAALIDALDRYIASGDG